MDDAIRTQELTRQDEALRRLARRLVGATDEVEDLVQSTWLTALVRPPRVLSRAWLERVLRSRARDAARRERVRADGIGRLAAGRPIPAAAEVARRLELRRELLEAVQELGEPYRLVVWLRYFEELPPAAIAAQLDLPLKTVKTRLARALACLRERLERKHGPGGTGWLAALAPLVTPPVGAAVVAPTTVAAATTSLLMLKKLVVVAAVVVLGLTGIWYSLQPPGRAPARGTPTLEAAAGDVGTQQPGELVRELPPEAQPRAPVEREQQPAALAAMAPAAGALEILVRWSDGTPAEGVRLGLRRDRQGLPRQGLATLVTDVQGLARADELPAGPVLVATDRGAGASAEVLAGQEVVVEVELPAGVEVLGIVVDARGLPLAGAAIWLTTGYTDWMGGHVVAESDEQGRFHLRDVPADQSLGAIVEGFAPSALVDLDLVDSSRPPVEVRLELLESGGALEGRVLDSDGEPAAGALVAVGEAPLHMPGRMGFGREEIWTPRTVACDDEGRFRIGGLSPGDRDVSVRAPGSPLWSGTTQVLAGETTTLEVQLEAGATVSGFVRDASGAPVEGALLRAFADAVDVTFLQQGQFDHSSAFGYPTGVSGPDGRYELRDLVPGKVHLYANPPRQRRVPGSPVHGAQERDEEVLEALPGGALVWDPVLEAGPTIAGRVTYLDGAPMPFVFVSILDEERGSRQALETDEEGRFRFLRLRGAPHTLSVQLWHAPEGAAPVQAEHVWPDGGEVLLVAGFPEPTELASGSVRGRVDDAGGRRGEGGTLSALLASHEGWWYVPREVAQDGFAFTDVKPGRYRPVVLAGDDPVLHGEWFELAPGEERDLGTLVTGPPGALLVALVRDEATAEVEPSLYLTLEGGSHGLDVELGREDEQRLDNLSAGTYSVTLRGEGLAMERATVTVQAGLLAELELRLRPGVLCAFEIAYPADASLGTLHLRIVDSDGEAVMDFEDSRPVLHGRPYSRLLTLPLGRFTLTAESQSGLAGGVEFELRADGPVQPSVQLELR